MVEFELEFSGISLDTAAGAVQSALEGERESESAVEAEHVMQTRSFGELIIELDGDYLKRKASATNRGEEGSEWLEPLSQAAALLVPLEVVCPPIPLNDLSVLTPVVRGLREAGAMGTEVSLIAAYGVHINTQIPRLDADTLFSYLRAFAIQQWWLVDAHEVDVTRRVSLYVDLYPQAYLLLGICRGAQLINVVLGGRLHQDVRRMRRRTHNRPGLLPTKQVRLVPDSILADACGKARVRGNSLHHQAIKDPGRGRKVVGWDLDQITQAVECTTGRSIIGVQWHPEYLVYLPSQFALFRWLLQHAK
jgi:anthranilate/para-aminobenzoate synthase component II